MILRSMHARTCRDALWILAALGAGCNGPHRGGTGGRFADIAEALQAEDPARRIEGCLQAKRARDPRAAPLLVDRLEESEPDVRFYAIDALKHISGQTHGYCYYAEPAQRAKAVKRWRQWLKQQAGAGEGL